eukprot:3310468-Pyramimonas_sp.AAC.1
MPPQRRARQEEPRAPHATSTTERLRTRDGHQLHLGGSACLSPVAKGSRRRWKDISSVANPTRQAIAGSRDGAA